MNVRTMLIVGAMALAAGCAENSDSTTQKITMEQTPVAVRRGIEKAYPNGKVKQIEKETYKDTGVVHYEVELVTTTGKSVEFEMAEDGEVLKKDCGRWTGECSNVSRHRRGEGKSVAP
jgi:hypothetical protein